jgi:hypothetical protein
MARHLAPHDAPTQHSTSAGRPLRLALMLQSAGRPRQTTDRRCAGAGITLPTRARVATPPVAGAFLRVREPNRRSDVVDTHQLDGTPDFPSSPPIQRDALDLSLGETFVGAFSFSAAVRANVALAPRPPSGIQEWAECRP